MHRRATERMARKRDRKADARGRTRDERCAISDREDRAAGRRSGTGAIAALVGGTLLKGLIVPLLSRLANRIPFGLIAQCVRTLWVRMFDRTEIPR